MHIIMKLVDVPGCLLYETQHLARISSDEVEVQGNNSLTPFFPHPEVKKKKKKNDNLECFTGHIEETGIALFRTSRFYRERASSWNLMKRLHVEEKGG